MSDFEKKYFKYKMKYNNLKKQYSGGSIRNAESIDIRLIIIIGLTKQYLSVKYSKNYLHKLTSLFNKQMTYDTFKTKLKEYLSNNTNEPNTNEQLAIALNIVNEGIEKNSSIKAVMKPITDKIDKLFNESSSVSITGVLSDIRKIYLSYFENNQLVDKINQLVDKIKKKEINIQTKQKFADNYKKYDGEDDLYARGTYDEDTYKQLVSEITILRDDLEKSYGDLEKSYGELDKHINNIINEKFNSTYDIITNKTIMNGESTTQG